MRCCRRLAPAALLALSLWAAPAAAQHAHGGHADPDGWRFGAYGIGLATHVTPAIAGESRTDAYLTQPVLSAHASGWDGRIGFTGMLNLEGLTLERGELNPGIWGEGYADKRHPHTYLHEAVGWVAGRAGGFAASAAAGKGFVPFGTDDPMARPFVKFPINHHLAQVLERGVAIGALRRGPIVLEAGVFNGDEPEGAADMPSWDRMGDSWAARTTLLPLPGLELQASHARVDSPEEPGGFGFDHEKWSASARWERRRGEAEREYALVEWARTEEIASRGSAGVLTSWLAEGALRRRGVEVAGRLERTLRFEHERLDDPFRTPHPHPEARKLGITRWSAASVAVSGAVGYSGLSLRPFVEAALLVPSDVVRPSLFRASVFYGDDDIWSLSAGVRMAVGAGHSRMGRYGVAAEHAPDAMIVHP